MLYVPEYKNTQKIGRQLIIVVYNYYLYFIATHICMRIIFFSFVHMYDFVVHTRFTVFFVQNISIIRKKMRIVFTAFRKIGFVNKIKYKIIFKPIHILYRVKNSSFLMFSCFQIPCRFAYRDHVR